MDQNEWMDVSATISDGMVHWPTDPPTSVFKAEEIGVNGGIANVTAISSSAHLGTHVDAPLHFFADGIDVASVDLSRLTGRTKVLQIKHAQSINLADIKNLGIGKHDRVLFRTRNSDTDWERQPFNENYVYLAEDAAVYLATKEVLCVGIDYLSIGGGDGNPAVHRILLGKSIAIIEGLKLGGVEPGVYDMVCLPLKIAGSDGAPARALLRRLTA